MFGIKKKLREQAAIREEVARFKRGVVERRQREALGKRSAAAVRSQGRMLASYGPVSKALLAHVTTPRQVAKELEDVLEHEIERVVAIHGAD